MTIGLFRFPHLVYSIIVKHMNLRETITLTAASKKSHSIVRICLACHKLHLKYKVNQKFELTRKYSNGTVKDKLTVRLKDQSQQQLVYPYQLWKFLGQDNVSIRFDVERDSSTKFLSYWSNKLEVMDTMLRFLVNLFPKLIVYIWYDRIDDVVILQNTMDIVSDVEIKRVKVGAPGDHRISDEVVRWSLEMCRRARELSLWRVASNNFIFDPETHPPLTFDSIFMCDPVWVTKDHMLKLFMTCKWVELEMKYFEDEDLKAIFEAWVEGSPMVWFQVGASHGFNRRKALANIVGHLPGAQVVRKANVVTLYNPVPVYEVQGFEEHKCYEIQQKHSGTKALVYQYRDWITFSIYYQIGEAVDRMPIDFDEERNYNQDDDRGVIDDLRVSSDEWSEEENDVRQINRDHEEDD